jgi:hypothetical protein
MAVFSYTDALAADRDRVRFAIGDTEYGSGPKPADVNFTDDELDGLITIEGTWQRAVAAGFENLASLWSKHVTFSAGGMSASQSDIAAQYRTTALEWRGKFGTAGVARCGSAAVTRKDGYSSDLDSVTA